MLRVALQSETLGAETFAVDVRAVFRGDALNDAVAPYKRGDATIICAGRATAFIRGDVGPICQFPLIGGAAVGHLKALERRSELHLAAHAGLLRPAETNGLRA